MLVIKNLQIIIFKKVWRFFKYEKSNFRFIATLTMVKLAVLWIYATLFSINCDQRRISDKQQWIVQFRWSLSTAWLQHSAAFNVLATCTIVVCANHNHVFQMARNSVTISLNVDVSQIKVIWAFWTTITLDYSFHSVTCCYVLLFIARKLCLIEVNWKCIVCQRSSPSRHRLVWCPSPISQ